MDLLLPVILFLCGGAFQLLRLWLANRRRRNQNPHRTYETRALLTLDVGAGPHRGRLVVPPAPDPVRWRARRDGETVDLAGARVLAATIEPDAAGARTDDALVRLQLPDGATARVVLHEVDAATLIRRLSDAPDAPAGAYPTLPVRPARSRRRQVMAVLVGLSAAWLVSWVYLVAFGDTVRATVLSGDGAGGCTVAWIHDGVRHTSEIDCSDEPAGATRTVWTLAWPARGEADDPGWTTGSVLALGAIPAAIAGAMWWADRRRARAVPPAGRSESRPAFPLLPELQGGDLRLPATEPAAAVLARLAPYADRQRPADGWEKPSRPAGSRALTSPWDVARTLGPPAGALAVLLLLTAPWPYRWYVLHEGPTAVAAGTSTGEVQADRHGPVPGDTTVRFRTPSGLEVRADAATTRDLPEGTAVTVRYAVARPGQARLDGTGDGLDRGTALSVAGLLLGLGWGVRRGVSLLVSARAVRRALTERRRPALALLTADPVADPVLLVCDPLVAPVRLLAVPLRAPLPHGAAAAFPADAALAVTALGRLEDGAAVVTELPGAPARLLLPAMPAVEADPELLAELLDGAHALARSVEEGRHRLH